MKQFKNPKWPTQRRCLIPYIVRVCEKSSKFHDLQHNVSQNITVVFFKQRGSFWYHFSYLKHFLKAETIDDNFGHWWQVMSMGFHVPLDWESIVRSEVLSDLLFS